MLIAHAPSGYIVAKTGVEKRRSFVICSLIFSLWPDLDLLYYYLLDGMKTFHHTYFPHLPVALLAVFLITLPLRFVRRLEGLRPYLTLFFINWAVHLVLDTFTGGVLWLYPLSDRLFTLFAPTLRYPSWVASFVFHWSFLFELAITAWAVALLFRSIKERKGEIS